MEGSYTLITEKKKTWRIHIYVEIAHSCVCVLNCFSHGQFFATLWTIAFQALPSVGFSSQEYWSGLLFPSAGNLPNPGIKIMYFKSSALADGFFTTSITWKPHSEQPKSPKKKKLQGKLENTYRWIKLPNTICQNLMGFNKSSDQREIYSWKCIH